MKFRKKPVVIEAERFDDPLSPEFLDALCWCSARPTRHIHTLEGAHDVSDGDWIIKGVAGEFYPCKPAIFDATYEAVEP